MARPRPCAVCLKWFKPNPRQEERQHTCGQAACRREWHRRACVKWHRANPGYDQQTRLVSRLVKDAPPGCGPPPDPLTLIDWELARDEIGLKVSVLVEETGKVLLRSARDAISA